MRFLPGLVLFLCAGLPADAAAQAAPMPYVAASIQSGSEIALADGRTLRLEGIEEPFADSGDWRGKAVQTLTELTHDHELAAENVSIDRYGRLAAQVYATDTGGHKLWLQGEMLRQGLAFVYPPSGGEARLDEMRAIETAARSTGTGIWGDRAYADIAAGKPSYRFGHFAFVNGAVLNASRVKNMVYIHFGEDWRKSFTIAIAAHDLRAFRAAHIDPLGLNGKTIRARGWVKRDIGPMIVLTNPAQIEVIETH